jgi:hypothetical protein
MNNIFYILSKSIDQSYSDAIVTICVYIDAGSLPRIICVTDGLRVSYLENVHVSIRWSMKNLFTVWHIHHLKFFAYAYANLVWIVLGKPRTYSLYSFLVLRLIYLQSIEQIINGTFWTIIHAFIEALLKIIQLIDIHKCNWSTSLINKSIYVRWWINGFFQRWSVVIYESKRRFVRKK